MNGVILKMDWHGCKNFLPELRNAICMQLSIALHRNEVQKSNENTNTRRFFDKRKYLEDGPVGKI